MNRSACRTALTIAFVAAVCTPASPAGFPSLKPSPPQCCAIMSVDRTERSLVVLNLTTNEVWRVVIDRSMPAGFREGRTLDFDPDTCLLLVQGYQPVQGMLLEASFAATE